MSETPETIFRYRSKSTYPYGFSRGPWNNEFHALFMTLEGVVAFMLCPVVCILALPYTGFPYALLALGFVIIFIISWNTRTFSTLLRHANIELTPEQVIIHISKRWKLPINLCDLHNVQIRKFTLPVVVCRYRMFVDWGIETRNVYFISSPGLPWYFRFAGLPYMFMGRGFFITSWHENYEAFLGEMRAFEA